MGKIIKNGITYSGAPTDASELPYDDTASTKEKIDELNTNISNLNSKKSHIGMIIHSTTLDTMEKVIDEYGGKEWISHSGYTLRGADSGVKSNDPTETGGADSVKLTTSHIPTHKVGNTTSSWYVQETTNGYGAGTNTTVQEINLNGAYYGTGGAQFWQNYYVNTHAHTFTNNSQQDVPTLPKYKSVYIWERVA